MDLSQHRFVVRSQAAVLAHLSRDPVMQGLVERFSPYTWGVHEPFAALVRAVVGQQISNAQARARFARLAELGLLDSRALAKVGSERLSQIGFPAARVRTLIELAELDLSGAFSGLGALSDQEVRERVLPVFGVGPWTADMLLIFGLGRINVWPTSDLGLRIGVAECYPEMNLTRLGEMFAPYRSAAAWYFWNLADQGRQVKLVKS